MENVIQKILQSNFLQSNHQGFLKNLQVWLINKTQAFDPTKKEFYWMRISRTLYPDGLNIGNDY